MKNNTIIVWTKDKTILSFVKKYSSKLSFDIVYPDIPEDIFATPAVLIIVSAEHLKEDFLNGYKGLIKYYSKERCKILVLGKKLNNLPEYFSNKIIYPPKLITESYLKKVVCERLKNGNLEQKELFSERIHRIIYIYDVMRDGATINTDDVCTIFNVSTRTVRRDIKILREATEYNIVYNNNGGFYIAK